MELWFFLGAGVVVLIVLAARNGAFRPFRRGDRRGTDAITQVSPRTTMQIRDPRAQIDGRDRPGR
jgi:hypothetical protein